eukprot:CAMPEP_0169407636 /NCGR_PEP_ID=MMETSP1017-20121227/58217_1 /TAXON_ID=342587 /ORGANISM="Karlodinium micrum, Strain CCMP2283" /LENGTH=840 /DNA_ID=CAMNT_0009514575 /DNA_START=67 /DNA_END=2586 /DNA_ORIENTATION=-
MLGSYSKRRSTQQRSSAAVEPPQSPQFGDNDTSGFGGGGGTGGADDDEDLRPSTAQRQSGVSRQRSPSSNNATPFDERIKSVRSRIREMVAVDEDSSDASETYESNPMRGSRSSVATRGSKSSNARSSASKAAATADQEGGESKATPKRRSKQNVGSSNSGEGQLVGRDGAAFVGARVRVLDPKVARYVEPTGVVVEVRCEGERVRVEHDGPNKDQRYYNCGKNGEYQIEFDKVSDGGRSRRTPPTVAESSDEEPAPTPAPKPKVKAAVKKGVARSGAAIIEVDASAKKSRYSQLREKRHSTCQEPSVPVHPVTAASSSTASATVKAVASSPRPESSPDPEGRKIPYAQRRSMRFSQAEVAEVAAVVAKATDRGDISASSPSGDRTHAVSPSRSDTASAEKSGSDVLGKDICSSSLNDQRHGAVDQLMKDNKDLFARLQSLEQSFAKDLGAVQDDVNRQLEITEKRIVSRVLDELEKRLRQATKTALSEPVKPTKLSMDVISSQEPTQHGAGTPMNYEPEQEYADSDLSECQPASSSRRPSELQKSYVDEALQKVTEQAAAEESKEELADNRQRLENIGNVARRINGSLSGLAGPKEPVSQVALRPENNGSQTPDFAATFSGSPSQSFPPPDGLDAEMARLADLRRFASNVMKAAEGQSQMMQSPATPTPGTWTDSRQHGWPGSSLPVPPHPEAQMYAGSHQMGLRDSANHHERQGPPHFDSADMEHLRMTPPASARRSMPAQMPGVPPPWAESGPQNYASWDAHSNLQAYSPRGVAPQGHQAHHMQAEAPSKQQFFRQGKGGRHSFSQPMRPSWPAAVPNGAAANEWDCTPGESEGRLV